MSDFIYFDSTNFIKPFGLNNIGFLCYLNTLIQSLLSCTSLNYILQSNNKYNSNNILNLLKNKHNNNLSIELFRELIECSKNRLDNIQFTTGQQDAHEGFMMLLHCINPELGKNNMSHPEIDRLFRHRYKKLIYCSNINSKQIVSTDEYLFMVIHEKDIESMKKNIKEDNSTFDKNYQASYIYNYITLTNEETDDNHICTLCDEYKFGQHKCKKPLFTQLSMLSEIIVILLKRYSDNKISDYIFDFPEYITFKGINGNLNYRSISQIEYSGNGNSGHYWCKCLRGDKWYQFNDNSVIESKYENTPNTYIIFYHIYK